MDEYIPIHFLGERLIFYTLSCAYLLLCKSNACYENTRWKRDSTETLMFVTNDGLYKIIRMFNLQYNPEILKDKFIDKFKEEYERKRCAGWKTNQELDTIISVIKDTD